MNQLLKKFNLITFFMSIIGYILNNLTYIGFCRDELRAAGGDMKMNWKPPLPLFSRGGRFRCLRRM